VRPTRADQPIASVHEYRTRIQFLDIASPLLNDRRSIDALQPTRHHLEHHAISAVYADPNP
jgi:hypothetical protein